MEEDFEKCITLLKTTFDLAQSLNLNVVIGVDLPLVRYWSSDCLDFELWFSRYQQLLDGTNYWLRPEDVFVKNEDPSDDELPGAREASAWTSTESGEPEKVENDEPPKGWPLTESWEVKTEAHQVGEEEEGEEEEGEDDLLSSPATNEDDNSSSALGEVEPKLAKYSGCHNGDATKVRCDVQSMTSNGIFVIHSNDDAKLDEYLVSNGDVMNKQSDNAVVVTVRNEVCSHCEETFSTKAQQAMHVKEKHCTCAVCGLTLLYPRLVEMHEATVHERMYPLVCPKCGRGIRTESRRIRHVKGCNPHRKPKYQKKPSCCYCSQSLSTFAELKLHQRTDHLTCSICNGVSETPNALKNHISLVHEKSRPYPCAKCGRNLRSKFVLEKHDRIVHKTRTRDFICSTCGKGFKDQAGLKIHDNVHNPLEKKFACNQCPKKFSSTSVLKNHVKTAHLGIKSYTCDECGKSFPAWSGLNGHKLFKHGGERNFDCSFCGKKFVILSHLKRHEKTHSA